MKVIPFQELVASNPEPRNWRANIISVLGTRLIWSHSHAQTLHFQWLILGQLTNQMLLTKWGVRGSDRVRDRDGGVLRVPDDAGWPGPQGDGGEDQAGRYNPRQVQTQPPQRYLDR